MIDFETEKKIAACGVLSLIIAVDSNNCVEFTNKFTGETEWLPDYIVEPAWTCDIEHIAEKWKTHGTTLYDKALELLSTLDANNRTILCSYIYEKYVAKKK